MCQIEYYEEQPDDFHSAVDDEKSALFKTHVWSEQADEETCQEVGSVAAEVLDERGFDLEYDVVVSVPEYMYVEVLMGSPYVNVAAMLSAGNGDFDREKHVLVVDAFMFDHMDDEMRRDVVAHELCHAKSKEMYGESGEQSDAFQQTLRRYDAPTGNESAFSDELGCHVADHPVNDR